jgi:glutaredoxin 3
MANILMYTSAYCPFCTNAERLLNSKGVTEINKIKIDEIPEAKAEMMAKTGRRTVPQIYIDDRHVGGFDDLRALDLSGELDSLLNAS